MHLEKNLFKTALAKGEILYGVWNGIPDPSVAQIMAGAGFDFICVDGEHGPFDLPLISRQLMALDPYPVHKMVRLPSRDPVAIKQYLDLGVRNFLIPMVESPEQATEIVAATRYPPRGIRGVGAALGRAARWNQIKDYYARADEGISVIVQVESVKAMSKLDEICSVEGIDGVFIGPADLAASMGYLGKGAQPEVIQEVKSAITRIVQHKLPAGVLSVDKNLMLAYRDQGATILAIGLDTLLLSKASMELCRQYKS